MNFFLVLIYKLNDFLNPKHIIVNFNFFKSSNMKIKGLKTPNSSCSMSLKKKIVFMMGRYDVGTILLQFPQILACLKNNYEIIILLSTPSWSIQRFYKKIGIKRFIFFHNISYKLDNKALNLYLKFKENKFSKPIIYKNVDILKILTSTKLRKEKTGNIDYANENSVQIIKAINASIQICDFTSKLIKEYNPEKFFFEDRGYFPDGIFFELAIKHKIDVIEFHVGHKSGILNYKRYNAINKKKHPFSISKNRFEELLNENIEERKFSEVMNELNFCYKKGEWYDEVGTAFFKEEISKKHFIKKYKLNPKYPIAIIFSHIIYDATLFFGKDIFKNYEDWLIKTIEYIKKIKKINWLIKCHPANLVKNNRDKKSNSEIEAIKNSFGEVPNHIKIIDHKSNESTLSLYKFIDYCLTVRGTVGIEAACYGIPVITAGTGRYDNLGFTIDSSSEEEYFRKLRNIRNFKKYKKNKIFKAIVFAHAILISKQLETKSINFKYLKTKDAKLEVNINNNSNFFELSDVIKLSEWFSSKKEDLYQ